MSLQYLGLRFILLGQRSGISSGHGPRDGLLASNVPHACRPYCYHVSATTPLQKEVDIFLREKDVHGSVR
jgi:hypothetical protein